MQTNRPPYETQLEPWPAISAALLTVLKATWLVLRELVKLMWRLTAILVPLVLGALVNMVLWHFRNPPPDSDHGDTQSDNSALWRPCDGPSDITHSDWESLYGDK